MSHRFWAFWGPRQESAEACARRMACMLEAFVAVHSVLSRWNKMAWTRKAADTPFCAMPPRIDELTKIFEKGKYYTDKRPRKPIEDLGFSVSAWNGHDDDCGVQLTVGAGKYTDSTSEPNSVQMELRRACAGNADFISAPIMKKMTHAVVEAWQPNWAALKNNDYTGATTDFRGFPLRPWGGWITYLSPPLAQQLAPAADIISSPLPMAGSSSSQPRSPPTSPTRRMSPPLIEFKPI
ncbi:MAG TPA: Imm52 family immunity protein [Alphaproteobacteria bacterium]|nr:Imm52 family immunity protein [Alphaproteobacteria bacterium]